MTRTRGSVLAPSLLFALVCIALVCAASASAEPLPWCGSGEPSTDLPDAVSAFEWHVIYAVPSDGQDRFGYFAPRIAGDVAAAGNWWVGQDPTRRPRYDLIDAPGCASDPQRVDISVVHLPHPNSAESYDQIQADLRAQGFASPDKAYLVYYDGSLDVSSDYGVCGEAQQTNDGPWAYSVVFLQTCFQSTSDDSRTETALHEMVHGMGAVDPQAPHYCDNGHVCDSPNDLMKAVRQDGDTLGNTALDVGRDDYYGHSGTWPDVRNSGLLYRLDLTLPPAPAVTATATSSATAVQVRWAPVAAQNGATYLYRVYDANGQVLRSTSGTTLSTTGAIGQTLTWTIRSQDAGGFLGPPSTIRFKVGYGLVDEAGTLVRDTVPPAGVANVRAAGFGKTLVFRWTPVSDPIGLRGYKVTAPGVNLLVKSATVKLPRAKVVGRKITIAAVDEAGNLGPAATISVR